MRFKIIAFIFLLFSTGNLATAILAKYIIPYLGFFPYKEIAQQFNLPSFLTSFANFDGAHYLLIAKNGYTTYQQAFFPLYPLLIRWLSPIFSNNLLLTGLIISNLSFLLGLFIFSKYLEVILVNEQAKRVNASRLDSGQVYRQAQDTEQSRSAGMTILWIILFLLAFPTSFFFGAVYTEGLFFLLFISVLYFLKKDKYLFASIFAILAAIAKFVGVFLILPIFFSILDSRLRGNDKERKFTNYRLILTLTSPILGLLIYSTYLWKTTGDPLFFLHSQWAFGAHRSSNLIFLPQVYYRYLNIFFTANWNFQYFISLFEFFIFNFVLFVLVLDFIRNCLPTGKAGKLEIRN